MASAAWTEEEQRLLEEGLLRAASVCNMREKWQAIARVVGTRDARACAERFKACRAEALERQRHEVQENGDQEAEEEEEDEGEEEGEGGAAVEAATSGAAASSSSGGGYANDQRDWKGGWWSQGWRSHGRGRGGHGGWDWKDGWSWEGSASWGAAGEDEAEGGSSSAAAVDGQAWQDASGQEGEAWQDASGQEAEDLSGLDEQQLRALKMRKEVEANRERLRLKQERAESERLRREQKKAAEEAEREKEKRESRERQERERLEQMEQQRLRKFLQEQEAKASMAKAAQFNPGFAPARMAGGREVKATARDWAAKANAGVKGQMAKQRKQELLEKQAAEALANIASSRGGPAARKQESSDEEDDAPLPPAPPPAARPAAPPPAKAGAPPPAKAPAAKAKASAPSESRRSKKRWWAKLDGDCPISLAPLSELPRPPFGLEAEGSSNMHYFDARFLASFLLSSCDFIDPVNRRPLTREECASLDEHLRQHYPEVGVEASVADAFTLFERHGTSGASQVHAVQREATAVLQHLFRFGSARRTDRRGRAIAYADAGLTVVDDDDILAAGGGGAATSAAPAEPDLERMTSADFPQLAQDGSSAPGGRGGWSGGRSGGTGGAEDTFPALATAKAKAKAWGPAAKVGAAAAKAKSAPGRGGGKGRSGPRRPDAW